MWFLLVRAEATFEEPPWLLPGPRRPLAVRAMAAGSPE